MRRKILMISLLFLVLCVACGDNSVHEIVIDVEEEWSGELVIALDKPLGTSSPRSTPYVLGDDASILPIHNAIQQFMVVYPDVTVKIIDTTWLTLQDGRRTLDYSPQFEHIVPDIIELTPHQARWTSGDELQELSFFIENSSQDINWTGDYAHLMGLAQVDAYQYLLPVRSDPMVMYYSLPIFEQHNIEVPTERWTWDDFHNTARQLKEVGQFAGVLKELEAVEHIIQAFGGNYFDDSLETYEAFRQYFEGWDEVVEHYAPFARVGSAMRPEQWAALGMIRASRMYQSLDRAEMQYELAPVPRTADGKATNTTFVTGLAITKASTKKDLAWELMKFIVGQNSEEAMQMVANNTLILKDERFTELPANQYASLVDLVREETMHSQPSSVYMWPTYVKGPEDADIRFGDAAVLNDGQSVQQFLLNASTYYESIREKMMERRLFTSF